MESRPLTIPWALLAVASLLGLALWKAPTLGRSLLARSPREDPKPVNLPALQPLPVPVEAPAEALTFGDATVEKSSSNPDRPVLVGIVITGLGLQPPPDVIWTDFPVTLAIRAHSPYALMIAQRAAERGDEVLVDAKAASDLRNASVPFATGFVGPDELTGPLHVHTLLHDLPKPPTRDSIDGMLAPRDPAIAVSNLLALARTTGAALLIVPLAHPDLGTILEDAKASTAPWLRWALSSEIARPEEVRGPPPNP